MLYRRPANQPTRRTGYSRRRRSIGGSLVFGLVIAAFFIFRYCSTEQYNEITGETQHISLTADQEVALGLQSLPTMVQKYGGLHPDQEGQRFVKQVGRRIVRNSDAGTAPYEYDFHLLADPRTVNAFALPGGQVFITAALFNRLETEDQLAGVFGHEIGHVVARHGAERIAKQELTQGLTGAAVVASGDYSTAHAAQMIGNLVNMKYGRDQELESDELGVRFMAQAGYDPEALIGVMRILEQSSGGQRAPEWQSTHPNPENRVERIREAIRKYQQ